MTTKNKFLYLGILPALFFQLVGALIYFLILKNSPLAPAAYSITKLLILIWPLLWLSYSRVLFKKRFSKKSILASFGWGLGTGLGIFGLILMVYFGFQDHFNQFKPFILDKVKDFNLEQHYLLYALFLSFVHSLLEEYYWRWFIFRGLMTRFSWLTAALIGSLAFATHHYVVLIQFFPALTTFLLGTAVGVGGFIWCMLYFKTGRLESSWLSHILADLAIMYVGYWIIF